MLLLLPQNIFMGANCRKRQDIIRDPESSERKISFVHNKARDTPAPLLLNPQYYLRLLHPKWCGIFLNQKNLIILFANLYIKYTLLSFLPWKLFTSTTRCSKIIVTNSHSLCEKILIQNFNHT